MANYYGISRSNYFRVKDVEAFKTLCARWSLEMIDRDGLVGFLDANGGGFNPDYYYDEETGDEVNGNLFADLAELLQENEVAVVIESGHEKHRYLIGKAIAIHSDGRQIYVSVDDIYQKALAEFGVRPTDASY
jgi:hypothetical protein